MHDHLAQVRAHAAAHVQQAHLAHLGVVLHELLVVRVQHHAREAELVLLDAAVGVSLGHGLVVSSVDAGEDLGVGEGAAVRDVRSSS